MGQITICDGQTTLTPVTTDSKEVVKNPWGIPTDPEKLVRWARIFAGMRDGDRAALAEPLRSGRRPSFRAY